MNAGIELLLKRMETHPEEFTEQGKWVQIMQEIHKYAEADESKTLNNALKALMMQKVTERVLEILVDPKPSKQDKWESHAYTSNTPLAGLTQGQSTVTLNTSALQQATWGNGLTISTPYQQAQVQQAAAQQTIFGKLYNYLGVNK